MAGRRGGDILRTATGRMSLCVVDAACPRQAAQNGGYCISEGDSITIQDVQDWAE